MRTIQFTVYNISELSAQARAKAIGDLRESLMETEDYEAFHWAKDDCALLEPAHDELVKIFGDNYLEKIGDEFIIKNLRKGIFWKGDIGEETEAMLRDCSFKITNPRMFLIWLGIPERFVDLYAYEFDEHGVYLQYLDSGLDNPAEAAFLEMAKSAEKKWDAHLYEIGRRIGAGVNEYFSDENVLERIEHREYEYLASGELYK